MKRSFVRPIAAISAIVAIAATGGLFADHDAVRVAQVQQATAAPLALHPENRHYFLFRGSPVLITSGEHYGAVLNLDFDYRKYLDTLAADGLNNTRIFSGAYVEPQGAFNIARNTLAPPEGRFICPWPRSDEPGYAGGGQQVRPRAAGTKPISPGCKDFVALGARAGHRRRDESVLPDVRGHAVEAQPDESREQRQRHRLRRTAGTSTRSTSTPAARRARGAGAADRRGAERVRQSILRDLQRAVLRRRRRSPGSTASPT